MQCQNQLDANYANDKLSCKPYVSRAKEMSAEAMVMPADGPSLGVAPSGTCKCTWA